MFLAVLAVVVGLLILVRSADEFVEGSVNTANYFKISPLIIGMVIMGFGTSLPEMLVSAISSFEGSPGIAVGNAYGSNIANIGLILGVTALISPVLIHSSVIKKELPTLTVVTIIATTQALDGTVTRFESIALLVVFALIMFWTLKSELKKTTKGSESVEKKEENKQVAPISRSIFQIIAGLVLLLLSSRAVVWGAVKIALFFGVSDMVVGLTIVAIGTSLPEFASSLSAIKKQEHDIVIGNILGSNLFNTLVVVGIAGCISPLHLSFEVLTRDITLMATFTLSIFFFGWNFGKKGKISRLGGGVLVTAYLLYIAYLMFASFS
ncbi:MAG: calcium/sodium antiporter [bacterium]